jgi:type VI secretion system secreted protein Hcp
MSQVDYFLKIDGIKGESTDSKHSGEIEIESWSLGATNAATFSSGGGGGAGKVQVQDFHLTKKYDQASAPLFVACATGKHYPLATIVARKAGGNQEEFLKIKLTDVMVSSYQTAGSNSSDIVPIDQVAIAFSKIEFAYKAQKGDGTLGGEAIGGWDIKTNQKV